MRAKNVISIPNAERPANATSAAQRWFRRLAPVAFWLAVWQLASILVEQEILIASPAETLESLASLVFEAQFWKSIASSLGHVALGFLLALLAGTACAALSSRFVFVRELLAPLVAAIKAVPVASFIILVLIWVSSKNLSVIISFLMAFPIMYTNLLEGILRTDSKLLEMADVFRVSAFDRVRFIYCSQVLPFFQAACSLALGMAWKAGIAAEVIGLPGTSIGENLYQAKIYLNTPNLFAWTLIIICISIAIERAFAKMTNYAVSVVERST